MRRWERELNEARERVGLMMKSWSLDGRRWWSVLVLLLCV